MQHNHHFIEPHHEHSERMTRYVVLLTAVMMVVEIISGVLPDEDVVFQGNYQIQYLKPAAKPVTAHTEGH